MTDGLKNTQLSGRKGIAAGNLFYCIAVAPQDEHRRYQKSFQKVVQSIRLID